MNTISSSGENERRDFFGHYIKKGSKEHKISFIDTVVNNSPLVEVVDIESHKSYNKIDDSLDEDDNYNQNQFEKDDSSGKSCFIY